MMKPLFVDTNPVQLTKGKCAHVLLTSVYIFIYFKVYYIFYFRILQETFGTRFLHSRYPPEDKGRSDILELSRLC